MTQKIAYLTDLHLDERFTIECGVDARKNWLTILEDVRSKGINEIVFGGDIGDLSSNEWFFNSLTGFNYTITLGNHDVYKEATKHYTTGVKANQTELFYTKELDFYTCIYLDTSSNAISEEQLNWLSEELEKTEKKIILFIHHPVFRIDAQVDKNYPLGKREKIQDLLLNSKKDITIFCGHYHMDDESTIVNCKQFITPAASYQIEKWIDDLDINITTYGYRVLELTSEGIKTNVVNFK